ncbi:hypothetical protein CBOM_00556 [Ceraceosorus bombacis]|uniref:Uncharacterized protein n=1 Tax=Ceraceosorus bombacis TaxID=401625 RepID=A0A0P1BB13_9BASI|nr:hypothetical protein CBOM_00556 [Ceraceosorus bombacis]
MGMFKGKADGLGSSSQPGDTSRRTMYARDASTAPPAHQYQSRAPQAMPLGNASFSVAGSLSSFPTASKSAGLPAKKGARRMFADSESEASRTPGSVATSFSMDSGSDAPEEQEIPYIDPAQRAEEERIWHQKQYQYEEAKRKAAEKAQKAQKAQSSRKTFMTRNNSKSDLDALRSLNSTPQVPAPPPPSLQTTNSSSNLSTLSSGTQRPSLSQERAPSESRVAQWARGTYGERQPPSRQQTLTQSQQWSGDAPGAGNATHWQGATGQEYARQVRERWDDYESRHPQVVHQQHAQATTTSSRYTAPGPGSDSHHPGADRYRNYAQFPRDLSSQAPFGDVSRDVPESASWHGHGIPPGPPRSGQVHGGYSEDLTSPAQLQRYPSHHTVDALPARSASASLEDAHRFASASQHYGAGHSQHPPALRSASFDATDAASMVPNPHIRSASATQLQHPASLLANRPQAQGSGSGAQVSRINTNVYDHSHARMAVPAFQAPTALVASPNGSLSPSAGSNSSARNAALRAVYGSSPSQSPIPERPSSAASHWSNGLPSALQAGRESPSWHSRPRPAMGRGLDEFGNLRPPQQQVRSETPSKEPLRSVMDSPTSARARSPSIASRAGTPMQQQSLRHQSSISSLDSIGEMKPRRAPAPPTQQTPAAAPAVMKAPVAPRAEHVAGGESKPSGVATVASPAALPVTSETNVAKIDRSASRLTRIAGPDRTLESRRGTRSATKDGSSFTASTSRLPLPLLAGISDAQRKQEEEESTKKNRVSDSSSKSGASANSNVRSSQPTNPLLGILSGPASTSTEEKHDREPGSTGTSIAGTKKFSPIETPAGGFAHGRVSNVDHRSSKAKAVPEYSKASHSRRPSEGDERAPAVLRDDVFASSQPVPLKSDQGRVRQPTTSFGSISSLNPVETAPPPYVPVPESSRAALQKEKSGLDGSQAQTVFASADTASSSSTGTGQPGKARASISSLAAPARPPRRQASSSTIDSDANLKASRDASTFAKAAPQAPMLDEPGKTSSTSFSTAKPERKAPPTSIKTGVKPWQSGPKSASGPSTVPAAPRSAVVPPKSARAPPVAFPQTAKPALASESSEGAAYVRAERHPKPSFPPVKTPTTRRPSSSASRTSIAGPLLAGAVSGLKTPRNVPETESRGSGGIDSRMTSEASDADGASAVDSGPEEEEDAPVLPEIPRVSAAPPRLDFNLETSLDTELSSAWALLSEAAATEEASVEKDEPDEQKPPLAPEPVVSVSPAAITRAFSRSRPPTASSIPSSTSRFVPTHRPSPSLDASARSKAGALHVDTTPLAAFKLGVATQGQPQEVRRVLKNGPAHAESSSAYLSALNSATPPSTASPARFESALSSDAAEESEAETTAARSSSANARSGKVHAEADVSNTPTSALTNSRSPLSALSSSTPGSSGSELESLTPFFAKFNRAHMARSESMSNVEKVLPKIPPAGEMSPLFASLRSPTEASAALARGSGRRSTSISSPNEAVKGALPAVARHNLVHLPVRKMSLRS